MPTLFSSSNMQLPFLRPESSPSGPSRGRAVNIRGQVSSLFTGRSVIQPRSSSDTTPKSPGPRLGLQVLSPEGDNLPTLDTSTPTLRRSPSSTCSMIDSASSPANTIRPLSPSTFERLERSANANRPRPPPRARTFSQPRSSRRGTSPEELVLVTFMDSQRRRNSTPKKASKITLRRFTLANIKNPKARGKAISCMVSGGLLVVILAIYLALAVSNPVAGQEFHVLLILIILMMTIFFVHSLIRLCMLVLRPERQQQTSGRVAGRMGTAGYAQPDRPIQITLARDEEIAIDEEEESGKPVLPPPPAYGLWRSSVRMNPNMVYWQKIESSHRHNRHSAIPEGDLESEPAAANRPPSYVSEDGVEYVIEAQPRPTVYESLPLHPSERGRFGTVPAR